MPSIDRDQDETSAEAEALRRSAPSPPCLLPFPSFHPALSAVADLAWAFVGPPLPPALTQPAFWRAEGIPADKAPPQARRAPRG